MSPKNALGPNFNHVLVTVDVLATTVDDEFHTDRDAVIFTNRQHDQFLFLGVWVTSDGGNNGAHWRTLHGCAAVEAFECTCG